MRPRVHGTMADSTISAIAIVGHRIDTFVAEMLARLLLDPLYGGVDMLGGHCRRDKTGVNGGRREYLTTIQVSGYGHHT